MSLVFYLWDLIQEVFTDISALGKLVFFGSFHGLLWIIRYQLNKNIFFLYYGY
jgi:hypothetical protein